MVDPTPFIMLFVVMDPVGVLPYFQSALQRVEPGERPRVLRLALLAAFIMLVTFTLLGDALFRILGVTVDDFRVAAGIILLVYAIASLFEAQIGAARDTGSLAIFPLATPLLAGPGAVSAVIYIKYTYDTATALLSIALNIGVAYPILASSTLLLRILGRHGALLVDKFMSLVMAGFAVSIIREGLA